MRTPIDIYCDQQLGDRPLTSADRAVVHEAYRSDPEFRKLVNRWLELERQVRGRVANALPDRELLVIEAMRRQGISLTEDERQRLLEAKLGLLAASESLEAYDLIQQRVADDLAAFDACWTGDSRQDRLSGPDRPPVRRTSASRWLWRVPVAAVLLFFVAIVFLLARRDAAFEHVVTGVGETLLLEFADGSAVHLRERSSFSYVPSERQGLLNRRARLEGQAFFEISPQQQGLVVSTRTASVTVIGTVFALAADGDATDLFLVDGRVSFAPEGAPRDAVTVTAGQHSRVSRGHRPSSPEYVDLAEALGWTGFFVFRSTPVAEIARRLEDHFRVRIHVAEELATEHVTGTFDANQAVDAILEIVATAVNAGVERVADGEYAVR